VVVRCTVLSHLLLVGRLYCCHLVCIYCTIVRNAVFTLHAVLLAIRQYSEGPATGHLDTGFSWFPCVYKQRLRRFPTFQVATTCFSCSPPYLNLLVTNFIFRVHVKYHCHQMTTQLQLINIIINYITFNIIIKFLNGSNELRGTQFRRFQ
jgi:hypothetical protein